MLYTFPARAQAPEKVTVGADTLKSAELQGLHLGMTFPQFEAAEHASHTLMQGSEATNNIAFFNNPIGQSQQVCGAVNLTSVSQQSNADPGYSDCIAATMSFLSGAGIVGEISSEQTLRGMSAEKLVDTLVAKYGEPTYVPAEKSHLIWVGNDPDRHAPAMVKIEATIKPLSAAHPGEQDLIVTMTDFQGKAPVVLASAAARAPKL